MMVRIQIKKKASIATRKLTHLVMNLLAMESVMMDGRYKHQMLARLEMSHYRQTLE
jgi:hypothetical protein